MGMTVINGFGGILFRAKREMRNLMVPAAKSV
jgi:hypothetical protein